MITAIEIPERDPLPLLRAVVEAFGDLGRYAAATGGGQRWPLRRLGERERIPSWVRRAVFERDGGLCCGCGTMLTLRTARLDHIVPWSALGPDTSDNLRVLCDPCNDDRSNFRTGLDDHAVNKLPVALVCVGCAHLDDDGEPIAEPYPIVSGMVHAYCARCGLTSLTCPEGVW